MGSGNFDFVESIFPEIYSDCVKAESYIYSDPVTACVYARRAIDWLTEYLSYDVFDLHRPYRDDIYTRLNNPEFRRSVANPIIDYLDFIRRVGNDAAHKEKPSIGIQKASLTVGNLFHVVVWAGYNHSAHPENVPLNRRFDANLAKRLKALNAQQAAQLREWVSEQAEEHRRAIEERERLIKAKDSAIAERQATIEQLREQIRQAQAATTAPDTHDYSIGEAETRAMLIDALLEEQGWRLDDTNREVEITGLPKTPQHPSGIGYADYVLWDDDGLPLAVVEAKRTAVSVDAGLDQAREYADGLEKMTGQRPVIFATNGYETKIWDNWRTADGGEAGYPARAVAGFYRKAELRRMIQRRTGARRLSGAPINTAIAGRPYQIAAIAAVDKAFDERQRGALLVMATGTGKTRMTIALVDQLMKAGWVRNVLFLADRTALVNQAVRAFRNPDTGLGASVPIVNLLDDDAETAGRIYVSTYPTMMNLIHARRGGDGGGELKFGPGFFDLVVVDEAHRSVYAKYGFLFDYFDSLLVGLTATPKNEVDRNTYRLFGLEYSEESGGVPTAAYSLDEAVQDGYLVPPVGKRIVTGFMRDGIDYDRLTDEEKLEWDEQEWNEEGDIPDSVDAGDINRFLFNADTIDKVLGVVMEQGIKVDDGNTLGKTIIFARNQRHAEAIKARFDIGWPQYGGTFAQIITHGTRNAQARIDDFSDPGKMPQIAISVDMLDTGVDVPEVVNLVFFKPVMSRTKYWQMIGRGTRLCPGLFGPVGAPGADKSEFLVFDCCGNIEFFRQNMPEASGRVGMSLDERLFRLRVGLLAALDAGNGVGGVGEVGGGVGGVGGGVGGVGDGIPDDMREYRETLARTLGDYVAGMDTQSNVLVRPHRRLIDTINGGDGSQSEAGGWWRNITVRKASEAVTLAGLPSNFHDDGAAGASDAGLSRDAGLQAKRFDELMYRYELGVLRAAASGAGAGGVAETADEAAEGAGADAGDAADTLADAIGLPERNLNSVRKAVQTIASELMSPKNRNVPAIAAQAELLEAVSGDEWWQDVTVPMLEHARKSLRGIAYYAAANRRNVVYTDFEDTLDTVESVELARGGDVSSVDYRRFRERALAFLREEDNAVLRRVRMGEQLTQQDLDELGRMLIDNGIGDEEDVRAADIHCREQYGVGGLYGSGTSGGADAAGGADGAGGADSSDGTGREDDEVSGFGLFIRSLVGLEPAAVQATFARFLDGKRYNSRQIEFVNHIVRELTKDGVMNGDRLYEQPFIDLAAGGPDDLFVDDDVNALFDILDDVKRSAIPLRKAA